MQLKEFTNTKVYLYFHTILQWVWCQLNNNATFDKEHCIHFSYKVLTEENMKTVGF